MPELLCILVVPLLVVATILWSMLGGVVEARGARARWGSKRLMRGAHGDGAYREGSLSETVPRTMPRLVTFTGVSGLGLAMLTGLAFAPSGLLLAGLMWGPVNVLQPWGGLLVVGALSGLSLSFLLHKACRSLLRSERSAGVTAKRVALYSFVHHVGLTAMFLSGSMYRPYDLAVAAVPAALGAVHAVMLFVAGEWAARAHASMSDEEQARLPDGA